MSTKLNDTYGRYLAEKRQLKNALKEVEAKIAALREAGAVDPVDAILPAPDTDSSADSAEPTLTQRALDIVNSLPSGARIRRSMIAKKLVESGYRPSGENFDITLFKTLIRLKKQGKITGVKDNGVWYFSPVEAVVEVNV